MHFDRNPKVNRDLGSRQSCRSLDPSRSTPRATSRANAVSQAFGQHDIPAFNGGTCCKAAVAKQCGSGLKFVGVTSSSSAHFVAAFTVPRSSPVTNTRRPARSTLGRVSCGLSRPSRLSPRTAARYSCGCSIVQQRGFSRRSPMGLPSAARAALLTLAARSPVSAAPMRIDEYSSPRSCAPRH